MEIILDELYPIEFFNHGGKISKEVYESYSKFRCLCGIWRNGEI